MLFPFFGFGGGGTLGGGDPIDVNGTQITPFNIPLPVLQGPSILSGLGTQAGWAPRLPEIPLPKLPQFGGIPTGQ